MFSNQQHDDPFESNMIDEEDYDNGSDMFSGWNNSIENDSNKKSKRIIGQKVTHSEMMSDNKQSKGNFNGEGTYTLPDVVLEEIPKGEDNVKICQPFINRKRSLVNFGRSFIYRILWYYHRHIKPKGDIMVKANMSEEIEDEDELIEIASSKYDELLKPDDVSTENSILLSYYFYRKQTEVRKNKAERTPIFF